jgi:putative aminopeptidase FrvX
MGHQVRKRVEGMGINVGTVVTFKDELMEWVKLYSGRALDNRIGGFMIAEVARMLKRVSCLTNFTS